MSTSSSARNLFPPLDNPDLTIRRRSRVDPTLLNNFEMATEGNGDPPVPDLRTMEELCQPTLNGRGRTFMKRHPEECYDLIENMTAHHNDWDTSAQRSESSSCITSSSDLEIVALKSEMAKINKNLIKVLQVNQQVKAVVQNYETYGGPHSYNDCLAIVGQTQNIYAARAYQSGNSYQPQAKTNKSSIDEPPEVELKDITPHLEYAFLEGDNKLHVIMAKDLSDEEKTALIKVLKSHTRAIPWKLSNIKGINLEFYTHKILMEEDFKPVVQHQRRMNIDSSFGSRTLPSNIVTNPKEDLKGIITRNGNAYKGPMIPTTSSSLSKVVERETEVIKDTVPPTNNKSTKDVQPPVVQVKTPMPNSEPVIAPIAEPVVAPISALKPNQKLSIPYPSRLHDQKLRDKANDQKEKIFQIFQDLNFNISFADALILMPKFSLTIKSLLTNKDKLFELARTPLNKHCSAVLLKKLTKKLGDPDKFLIPGIDPKFYTHKIIMEDDFEPSVQHQRRVNPKIHDVIKKEVLKLLDAGFIYPISDSPWVSPLHCVPKMGGFTVVENEENELIPTRLVTGWRVCIDYRKLNEATRKDHFLLPFMDQMLDRLAANEYYCFLDGFSGYFQIPIDPKDQEKTSFTYPYGTFAYSCMPFGLYNAPGTFQRCMMAIFHDMIKKRMEVFMDDFSVFRNSFETCLSYLDKMLQRCEDINLCLNWEKRHFMVKEGIVLGHKISKNKIEVDKAKVDVIAKLPHPTTVKGIRSFLGHAGFYRRFIQRFSS
nr:reverse transcriptase domain-containing protein [Tanacetum cinerariifolium]